MPTAEEIETHEHLSWEAAAETYAEFTGFATALGGQIDLALELGEINDQSRVLDLGCGPGQLTDALHRYTKRISGVDFSANMVREAKTQFPEIAFRVANAETLPFDDGTFDVVVCCYTAHHFARPDVAFREQRRVLAPGGRFVVISPIQSQMASMAICMQALAEGLPDMKEELYPGGPLNGIADPEVYARLLRDAGFEQVTAEVRVKPLIQKNLDQLTRTMWRLAELDDQPKDTQLLIRMRIEELSSEYLLKDGSYSFPDNVITCVAR